MPVIIVTIMSLDVVTLVSIIVVASRSIDKLVELSYLFNIPNGDKGQCQTHVVYFIVFIKSYVLYRILVLVSIIEN